MPYGNSGPFGNKEALYNHISAVIFLGKTKSLPFKLFLKIIEILHN